MTGFAKSTVWVTGFRFFGLCLGFLANLLIAARFGTGADMDAYLAATTLPLLVAMILATSLSSTFVPVFTECREKTPGEARRIAGTMINLVLLVTFSLAAVGITLSEPIARLIAPGLTPSQTETTASLIRWLFPGIALTVLNELISALYYTHGKFIAPTMIRIVNPLLTILAVWYFGPTLGVRSLVAATLLANLLQTCILVTGLYKGRFAHLSFGFGFRHPVVQKTLKLMVPMAFAMCFYKLGSVFERWLASGMGPGSISTLGYAMKVSQVLQPLLISGISISGFALMSSHVSKEDMGALKTTLTKSCGMLLFLSIPLAVLLSGFGRPLVALLFERGAFTSQDTLETSRLFSLYVLALPATAVGAIIGQAMYAFQDTRTPTLVGILDFILFAGVALALAPQAGLLSLPISYNVSFYATVILLCVLLSRKAGFSVLALFGRSTLTSLIASVAALGLGWGMMAVFPASGLYTLAALGICLFFYFFLQWIVFGSPEANRFLDLFQRKAPQ